MKKKLNIEKRGINIIISEGTSMKLIFTPKKSTFKYKTESCEMVLLYRADGVLIHKSLSKISQHLNEA